MEVHPPSSSSFPEMHNFGKAVQKDSKIMFTYMDSYGNAITETKIILTPLSILKLVNTRLDGFIKYRQSRESDGFRADRKYISAHPKEILLATWEIANKMQKMELEMMLSKMSHIGISDPEWARKNEKSLTSVIGNNGKEL